VKVHVLATEGLHELRLVVINKEESHSATLDVTVKGVIWPSSTDVNHRFPCHGLARVGFANHPLSKLEVLVI